MLYDQFQQYDNALFYSIYYLAFEIILALYLI